MKSNGSIITFLDRFSMAQDMFHNVSKLTSLGFILQCFTWFNSSQIYIYTPLHEQHLSSFSLPHFSLSFFVWANNHCDFICWEGWHFSTEQHHSPKSIGHMCVATIPWLLVWTLWSVCLLFHPFSIALRLSCIFCSPWNYITEVLYFSSFSSSSFLFWLVNVILFPYPF